MDTKQYNYQQIQESLPERQKQVYNALIGLGCATNNMISMKLRLPINSITPRIFELRKKGLVVKSHTSWCPVRKTKCNYWKVK